jgi:hypothetical protein
MHDYIMHDDMVTITVPREVAQKLWEATPKYITHGEGGPLTTEMYKALCKTLGKCYPPSQ